MVKFFLFVGKIFMISGIKKTKLLGKLFSAALFVTVGIFVAGGNVRADDVSACTGSPAPSTTVTSSTATLNWTNTVVSGAISALSVDLYNNATWSGGTQTNSGALSSSAQTVTVPTATMTSAGFSLIPNTQYWWRVNITDSVSDPMAWTDGSDTFATPYTAGQTPGLGTITPGIASVSIPVTAGTIAGTGTTKYTATCNPVITTNGYLSGTNFISSPGTVTISNLSPSQQYICTVVASNASNFSSGTATTGTVTTLAIPTYTVATSLTNVTADQTSQTINQGSTATFNFTATNGYYISSVSGCGGTTYSNAVQTVTTKSYTTGTISAACTVTAVASIKTFVVTPSLGSGGTAVSPTSATVNWGTSQTFTTTNTSGYSISSVTFTSGSGGDGTVGPETYNIVDATHFTISNVTATTGVTVAFSIAPTYNITATFGTDANGTNSTSGSGTISCTPPSVLVSASPTNSVCTITPGSTYYLSNVKVDGVSVGGAMTNSSTNPSTFTYTFFNVAANHTIAAIFTTNSGVSTILSQSTYTSSPIQLTNTDLGFGTINWAPTFPGTASNIMEMRVRSCATADPTCAAAQPWTSCGIIANTQGDISIAGSPTLTNGLNCLTPGQTYVQYQVVMATTDATNHTVPNFGPVVIKSSPLQYSTAWQSLVSSPFDSGNTYTALGNITWNGGGATGTGNSVKFQIRTAPENSAGTGPDWTKGSGWCGPGDASNCSQTMGNGIANENFTAGVSSPNEIAFDSSTNSIWVSNRVNNNPLSKISVTSGSASLSGISLASVMAGAQSLVFDGSTNSIWAANDYSGYVYKLNPLTGGLLATSNDSATARGGIAFDSSTNSVWVTNRAANTVSKLKTSDATIVGSAIAVGATPKGIAFDNFSNSVWVANTGSSSITKIKALDGTITSTTASVPAYNVAYDSSSNAIWVTSNTSSPGKVTKLRVSDGVVLNPTNNIATPGSYVTVGNNPQGITFDSSTNSIWVANNGDGTVSQINVATGTVVGTYTVGTAPVGVAFDSSTNSIWVTNSTSNNLTRIIAANPTSALSYYKTNSANTTNSTQANTARVSNASRWIQYAYFAQATSGTSATVPAPVTNVTIPFSFNSPPAISVSSLAQVASGADASKVQANYNLSDPDYNDFSDQPSNQNKAYPGFFYQPSGVTATIQTPLAATSTFPGNQYVVPAGVQAIKIDANGAGYGSTDKGGSSTGILAVSTGQTYYTNIGLQNAGGHATATNANSGGGMTWFASNSNPFLAGESNKASIIMVAGGAGGSGSGGSGSSSIGAIGGGANGASVSGGGVSNNAGGKGGSPTTGGAGGANSPYGVGQPGGFGFGGAGDGAGGGAGYYGGGGGGSNCPGLAGCGTTYGGGGGSGFVDTTKLTSASTTPGGGSIGDGSLTVTPLAFITVNNNSNQPIPQSGMLLIDGELIKFSGGVTTSGAATLTVVQRAACFDDPSPASGSVYAGTYCTTQATHSANAMIYFEATQATYDGVAQAAVSVTATPASHAILWDAKNEPNLTQWIGGANTATNLNNNVWQNWNFKIAADDGGYGTNVGAANQTLSYLDLQPPTANASIFNLRPFTKTSSVTMTNDANDADLLQNGGFENGSTGWTLSGPTIASDQVHTGSSSLKFSAPNTGQTATATTVAVQPSTQYTISGWAYDKMTSGSAYLDLSDAGVNNTSNDINCLATNSLSGWQYVSCNFTTNASGASSTSLTVRAVNDGNAANTGNVWWDDIQLAPVSGQAGAPGLGMSQMNFGDVTKSDDFESGSLNSSKWATVGVGTPAFQNGTLYLAPGINQTGGISSSGKYTLSGDFDIQTDFSNFFKSGTYGALGIEVDE